MNFDVKKKIKPPMRMVLYQSHRIARPSENVSAAIAKCETEK
jgi:hypothetical protein